MSSICIMHNTERRTAMPGVSPGGPQAGSSACGGTGRIGSGGGGGPGVVGLGRWSGAGPDPASSSYSLTYVRYPWGSSFSPRTVSRKRFCTSRVIGPAFPSPISMRSTLRTGVTSAAVPVKNISSTV